MTSAMDILSEQEQDTLDNLEARVAKTVELVAQLRAERDAAREEASRWETEATTLRNSLTKAEQERETMQAERKAVRSRIEKLLGQMDLLSSES